MDSQERWYYNHLHDLHKRKLEVIQTQSSSKRIDNSIPETLNLNRTKVSSFQSTKNREFQDIYKKNQVLLEALEDIRKRKVRNKQKRAPSVDIFTPSSLNIYQRKKDIEKITKENGLLHQKLTSKEATLSMKQLDRDYQVSLKYKKNLSKKFLSDSPKKKEKKKKLPRIGKDKKKAKKEKKEKKDKNNRESANGKEENEKVDAQNEVKDDKPEFVFIQDSKPQEDLKNENGRRSEFLDKKKPNDNQEITGILEQNVNIDLIKKFSLREIITSPHMFLQDKPDSKLVKNNSSPPASQNPFNLQPKPDPPLPKTLSKLNENSSPSSSSSKESSPKSNSSSKN